MKGIAWLEAAATQRNWVAHSHGAEIEPGGVGGLYILAMWLHPSPLKRGAAWISPL